MNALNASAMELIRMALAEDLGRAGDITTDRIVPVDTVATASFVGRAPGRLAGIEVAQAVFAELDPTLKFDAALQDGAAIEKGSVIATLSGPARAILTGERTALNFLCRLSGIATETARLAALIAHTKAHITDTRKTAPGWRALEKYAVRCGGGRNHRFGLDDAIQIKDNHVAVAGGVSEAIRRARQGLGHLVKIEVEVDTLDELDAALETGGVDSILLDNMPPDILKRAVARIAGRVTIVASGGITPSTIAAIAESGVDLVAAGWITHSAPILDIGLDID